jgi:hypothetical protein
MTVAGGSRLSTAHAGSGVPAPASGLSPVEQQAGWLKSQVARAWQGLGPAHVFDRQGGQRGQGGQGQPMASP